MTSWSSAASSHALVSLLFVLSRVGLDALGLQFYFALDWMWLADPADLRDRLFETLWYYHAFPPGMNALTGFILDCGGAGAPAFAHGVFWVLGLVFVNALCYLSRLVGLSPGVAGAFALVFLLTPSSIYFEHLYHYDWPVTALLALGAALFAMGVRQPSRRVWFACFAACALIGLTRSTFHLIWFAGVLALAVWLAARRSRRLVLQSALLPAAVLLALYAKNYVVFGEFVASTFGPASFTLVTVASLPDGIRDAWIDRGDLSPFAAVSVYAPPRQYARFFSTPGHRGWPGQLTRLEHTAVDAPNYNHWWLLEVHRARRGDVRRYLRERAFEYPVNVARGIREMFRPSTRWHPRDGTPASPHYQHRQVLGGYETWFNRIVHGVPFTPFGLYVFLPVLLIWAIVRARALVRAEDADARAQGALCYLCIFQIVYVVAASTMLTALEWPRYRYPIEWSIWLLAAAAIAHLRAPSAPGAPART